MNVSNLIELLERIKTKDAVVYLHDSSTGHNELLKVIIEHDVADDEIVVILKTEDDD